MQARALSGVILLAGASMAQSPPNQSTAEQPRLKTRTEVLAEGSKSVDSTGMKIVPAGTRIPIQLRQPVSTKTAQAGDPIYAQTTFPIVVEGAMVIPAGTWVQGTVDMVKRAGRIKGTAELQFHLTTLIYPNGYSLSIAAAIDHVPGDIGSRVQEPGTVKHESEKGKDLERIGTGASQGGQIGSLAGVTASPSIRGLGVGGLSGVAAGTLIALLARGTDVKFDTGTAVEVALNKAMAIELEKVGRSAGSTP